jgi:hypothetical protein
VFTKPGKHKAKFSEIAEKSERQIAGVMEVSMRSQNVQKKKPADYQLSEAVSNRTANYHELTNVGGYSADR